MTQLLANFPADALTSRGQPFWSPPRRTPRPIPFDAADPLHLQFVLGAAKLRAASLGTPDGEMEEFLAGVDKRAAAVGEIAVPEFTPRNELPSVRLVYHLRELSSRVPGGNFCVYFHPTTEGAREGASLFLSPFARQTELAAAVLGND